jgi:hypothetical protein
VIEENLTPLLTGPATVTAGPVIVHTLVWERTTFTASVCRSRCHRKTARRSPPHSMVAASVLTAARCCGVGGAAHQDRRRVAAEITDRRDPMRVVHALSCILRARILAIACGYEDADDLDICVTVLRSSWPAVTCLTAGATCVRSRPCRVARMRRACAR